MGHTQWKNFLFFQAIAAHICVSHFAASVSIKFKEDQCYGAVDIRNTGWETFCDDRWDFNNSKVLCRQTNCGTALKPLEKPTANSPDFLCNGHESSIDECSRKENRTQSCKTSKAYVVCSKALSQPSISVTLPNGELVESKHVEIPRHSKLVFSCSVNFMPKPDFILQFNGTTSERYQLNVPAIFEFSADYQHEGNYSCVYEVNLNGTYRSNETEWIHLIVTDPWWNMLFYVLPAGILVLLMVLLVACLVRRRRRRAEKPKAVVLCQMTTRNYSVDEDDEEDEGDYVNVEPVDNKSLRAEEVEDDYNDSNDYEEPDEVAVALQGNSEEQSEEEDNSDDENDYVNLEEKTVDIYGEELDIYENF